MLLLDSDDLVLGVSQISGVLAPRATYSQTIARSIPQAIFGEYFIIVATDTRNQVYEHSDEEDNARVSDVSELQICV